MSKPKHPIQPVVFDDRGVARFKENPLVSYLVDKHDLNALSMFVASEMTQKQAERKGFKRAPTEEDYEQLMMLIGYSVSGAGGLDCFSDETWGKAWEMQQALDPKEDE